MAEVRATTYRDIDAMALVLKEEADERKRQEQVAARRKR